MSDSLVTNKLILLFFMDKMDVPMTESAVLKAVYYDKAWLEYMDCMSSINQLEENGFLYRTAFEKTAYFSITPSGRSCISEFYARIPSSVRTDITDYVRENRLLIRRRSEYSTSYQLNPDRSYSVILKIIDPTNPTKVTMDLKFVVPNKETAKAVAEKWSTSAGEVYLKIYEQLVD